MGVPTFIIKYLSFLDTKLLIANLPVFSGNFDSLGLIWFVEFGSVSEIWQR